MTSQALTNITYDVIFSTKNTKTLKKAEQIACLTTKLIFSFISLESMQINQPFDIGIARQLVNII